MAVPYCASDRATVWIFHIGLFSYFMGDELATIAKSLRKNRLNSRVFPSFELIALCSGWISAVQRLRPADCSD